MCIIIVKHPASTLPTPDVLWNCWFNNSDGAGLAYAAEGRVYLHKGFKHLTDLERALELVPAGAPALLHFRIGTSGKKDGPTCHPYPVTPNLNDLRALSWSSSRLPVMAHNGVLHGQELIKGYNDTQSLIHLILAPVGMWHKPLAKPILKLVDRATQGSRLAFLWPDGRIALTGSGWVEGPGDCVYSNTGYMRSYSVCGSWRDDRWDGYYDYSYEGGTSCSNDDTGRWSDAETEDVELYLQGTCPECLSELMEEAPDTCPHCGSDLSFLAHVWQNMQDVDIAEGGV